MLRCLRCFMRLWEQRAGCRDRHIPKHEWLPWWGKQHLGQAEKNDNTNTSAGGDMRMRGPTKARADISSRAERGPAAAAIATRSKHRKRRNGRWDFERLIR